VYINIPSSTLFTLSKSDAIIVLSFSFSDEDGAEDSSLITSSKSLVDFPY
jgi:hypothetical protein